MKKMIVAGILVALVFGGCNLFPSITFDDIKGEWDFPATVFNNETISSIHLSLMDPNPGSGAYKVDLSWNDFNNFYYGDGTMNGNVFTGTYYVGGDLADPPTQYSITITFSLNDNKLKAIFKGQGPLDGLILEHGVKATT